MPLAVIGAGQGRTGTRSLGQALDELGFGPCYHGGEQIYIHRNPGWRLWLQALRKEPTEWDKVFDGFRASVDSPGCVFYRELAEEYPSAKVILTVRDSDSWFASAWSIYLSPQAIRRIEAEAGPEIAQVMYKELALGFGPNLDRHSVIEAYERHNAEVQKAIGQDRLLVYEVSQGWGPLCQFLGVPIPDTPFPYRNARQ